MDKEKYLKEQRKRKENYLRYRLGFLQLIHKPILNMLLISLVALFIYWIMDWENPINYIFKCSRVDIADIQIYFMYYINNNSYNHFTMAD